MRSRIALSVVSCSMMLASFPVFAESVRIHDSSSVHIHGDGGGTTATVEERRVEERSGGVAAGASLRVQSDESGKVIRSESLRRATCVSAAGDTHCTEEVRGEGPDNVSARVSVNGKDWWSGWRDRILRAARQVGSETAEDKIESTLNRTQARLARRICVRFERDEREACLEDALKDEGSTVRLRLRDWIERL